MTHWIAKNWQAANLDLIEERLCQFASALTNTPHKMNESHILELREAGLSDAAIHDASQVISYFNYINRIADSLDVDLEDDVHQWELSATPNS